MSVVALNVAASEYNAAFWLALAGITAGLLASVGASIATFRTNTDVARTNYASQLAIKKAEEESRARESRWKDKGVAIREFVAASDMYWQSVNGLWARVKRSEPVSSYWEEMGKVTEGLTLAKAGLDLVADGELSKAAEAYHNELVDLAKYVYENRNWRSPNRELKKAVISLAKKEIDWLHVEKPAP
ncbi:hypothetical protein [Streptomyces prunicolor]